MAEPRENDLATALRLKTKIRKAIAEESIGLFKACDLELLQSIMSSHHTNCKNITVKKLRAFAEKYNVQIE